MAREQLKTLTEPMYYILLSLTEQRHGYGIMQAVDQMTKGRVSIGAGTLYALLGRFEKENIIVQVRKEDRKKIYSLTSKGRQLLTEEFNRLNQLVLDGSKQFDQEGRLLPPKDGEGRA